MRVLLALLLVVGLVGCGSETEPPSPFSESEAKPPTAAVPPTPPESTQAKVENVVADTPQPKVDADPVSKPKSKSAPGSEPKADKPPAQVAVADPVAAMKKLGARIKRDDQGRVIELNLRSTLITDAGLVHLMGLTNLTSLNLSRTKVTEAGLLHLKGLTGLQALGLGGTKITDAGLVHLKGLQLTSLTIPTQARTDLGLKHYLAATETHTSLTLESWRVTDSGLVHLRGLTELQTLNLPSQITDAGIAEFQKALPNCTISQ